MSITMRSLRTTGIALGVTLALLATGHGRAAEPPEAKKTIEVLEQELKKTQALLQEERAKCQEVQALFQKQMAIALDKLAVAEKVAAVGQQQLAEAIKIRTEAEKSLVEMKKLQALLTAEVKDKDRQVAELQAEKARLTDIVNKLQQENLELKKKLAGGQANPNVAPPKQPIKPNPPQAFIKGIIEKVDAGGTVIVSLGSDQGLMIGHTLEVFRMQPQPQYLGMLQIMEVTPHKSIGRLVGTAKGELKVGDQVASQLAAGN